MTITLHHTDMLAWLRDYDGPLFDSCVTDPPYHLTSIVKRFGKPGRAEAKVGATGAYARASRGFMGKEWDGGDIAFRPETWRAVFDALKPGAHLVAFSGTRTYHRMACATEDAGFEIRDQLAWCYGSGFPKSHDVSKGIDKAAGAERPVTHTTKSGGLARQNTVNAEQGFRPDDYYAERGNQFRSNDPITPEAAQWQGWGTALKPAWEPICLARKPLAESSVAANVLAHGTGAINVDGCRVEAAGRTLIVSDKRASVNTYGDGLNGSRNAGITDQGRFPANILHDGSGEVVGCFPDAPGQQRTVTGNEPSSPFANIYGDMPNRAGGAVPRGDSGSAARFFYSAKAGPLDRMGSKHATVKPVDLMRWLARLVTPPGGYVLEPFAGSGTTGIACLAEGFGCTMLELEAEHVADIERKLAILRGDGRLLVEEHKRGRHDPRNDDLGPLFGSAA